MAPRSARTDEPVCCLNLIAEHELRMGQITLEAADCGSPGAIPSGDGAMRPDAESGLQPNPQPSPPLNPQPGLLRIAACLQALGAEIGATASDFADPAVLRRLHARMRVLGLIEPDDYAVRLASDPIEAQELARELSRPQRLIFRDGELYAGLLRQLSGTAADAPQVQIWVPDCGRGEAVYALAMLAAQIVGQRRIDSASADALPETRDFRIYGSDPDLDALVYARSARFEQRAAARVPPSLRSEFLQSDGDAWRVAPTLRAHTAFLRHALADASPLFGVDLISARHLFADLEPSALRVVLEQMHAALRSDGVLAAGDTPLLLAHADLFVPLADAPGLLARVERRSAGARRDAGARAADPAQLGAPESYRQIFVAHPEPGLIMAGDGRIVDFNPAARQRFATLLTPGATPGLGELLRIDSRTHEQTLASAAANAASVAAGGAGVAQSVSLPAALSAAAAGGAREHAVVLFDGSSATLQLLPLNCGDVALWHLQLRDVDGGGHLQMRLQQLETLAQTTMAALAEGIIQLDAAGNVQMMNPTAERLTGWTLAEALQQPYSRVFRLQSANGQPLQDHPIDRALAGERVDGDRNDLYLRARDSSRYALRLRLRATADRAAGLVLVFDDVSQMNLLTEELAYRASHDPLTGLLNRAEFETRARAVVAEAQRSGSSAVLCYVDVDQFKVINDTLGHAAGDELLHELAAELRSRVAEHDTFARLGGDEFGILLNEHDLDSARSVADSLIDTARRFRFAWQGHTYAVTISIGAALIDRASESVARAMSMADAACFVAKDAGRDRVLFAGNDDELASRHVQMSMVGKIGKSLDEDRFVLHYEDVVAIAAPQQVVYRELLVRMREADGRLLLPASFIQAAERYFLMGALDRWVLRNALRGIARLPEDRVIYAVNLSGQSLGDEKFLDFVLAELDASRVDPQRICFEITETAAVSRMTEAVRFIARISQCGCRFALDDFGSGMASFNYLKNFNVHFLKIDGSFVRAMLASRTDRGMVESINRIGHEMGLKTIAEHVETPAMLAPLREMGVDWVQGRAVSWGKPFDALLS